MPPRANKTATPLSRTPSWTKHIAESASFQARRLDQVVKLGARYPIWPYLLVFLSRWTLFPRGITMKLHNRASGKTPHLTVQLVWCAGAVSH